MEMTQVLKMGDPILLKKSEPIADFSSTFLRNLIKDMKDAMKACGGAGISAPQVGYNKRVISYGFDYNPRYPNEQPIPKTTLINPEYVPLSYETEEAWEGCLSIPGLRGLIPRYKKIRYYGYDGDGNHLENIAEGFQARVIQHECDHLNGILFTQRIKNMKMLGYEDVIKEVYTDVAA